jgi:FixJ family two-component response regulator
MNLKLTCARLSQSEHGETPSVFIVDEDISVRQSLASLVRSAGWQPVTAASAEEYLACPPCTGPGCLLTELRLPAASGLELQRSVSGRAELPVIFLTSDAHVHAIVQAMKAGAFEFLSKPVLRQVLLKTIHEAIDHSRAVLLHFEQARALQRRYQSLTRREREVMSLVVSGWMNKQVGGELGISVVTVKAHRGRMMRKMQAGCFAELVSMAASLRGGARTDLADRSGAKVPWPQPELPNVIAA